MDKTYQSIVDKARSKLFASDMDQIVILQHWHQIFFSNNSTSKKDGSVLKFTNKKFMTSEKYTYITKHII